MKNRSKLIWICIMLIVCMAILGWCAKTSEYKLVKPEDNITNIELVYIENNLIVFYEQFDKIEVKKTIPQDEWKAFLNEIDELPSGERFAPPCDSISGLAVKITYDEEDFELVNYGVVYYFDNEDGEYIQYYFKDSSLDMLILDWLNK